MQGLTSPALLLARDQCAKQHRMQVGKDAWVSASCHLQKVLQMASGRSFKRPYIWPSSKIALLQTLLSIPANSGGEPHWRQTPSL